LENYVRSAVGSAVARRRPLPQGPPTPGRPVRQLRPWWPKALLSEPGGLRRGSAATVAPDTGRGFADLVLTRLEYFTPDTARGHSDE